MAEQKQRVLVVEDDEYSRDALTNLLASEGYEALAVNDGESGYAKARERRPDIILLDLSLPGIDGKHFIQLIRTDPLLESVPILVVTGSEDREAQSALDLGADAYLTKPVEFNDLINMISRLDNRSLAGGS